MRRRLFRNVAGFAGASLVAGCMGAATAVGAGLVPPDTAASAAGSTTSAPFTVACTNVPAITHLKLVTTTIAGTITPNPVPGGTTVTVSTLLLHVAVKKTLAALAKGNKLGVTVTMAGAVAGATPSATSLRFHSTVTVPETATATIPSTGLPITAPGTASPATFTAASSGTVTIGAMASTTAAASTTTLHVTLAGSTVGQITCENPAVAIAEAAIKPVTAPLAISTTSLPSGTVTVSYSTTLVATGGTTPYTWSATGLPTGLNLATTGTITGTPTAVGTSTVTIEVTDGTGHRVTKTLPLDVEPTPLAITTTTLPGAVVTAPYSTTLVATGGTTPYTWSATGLPTGLNLATTGTITGTPTAVGTSTVAIKVTDSEPAPVTVTKILSLAVNPKLSITTTALPVGAMTAPYVVTLAATGGTKPYSWTATGLPAGLTLATTGTITGTPANAGTTTVSITVTDAESPKASRSVTLPLTVDPPLAISTATLPAGAETMPYGVALAAAGGIAPYAWAETGLPAGLDLSTTGRITGTPAVAATSIVTVTVTGTTAVAVTRSFALHVAPTPLAISTPALPEGVVTVPYTATLAAIGGTKPYSWSATGLPAGLTLAATGTITGTSATAGTTTVSITVTDAESPTSTDTVILPLTVSPALAITVTALPGGTAGSAYSASLTATGGLNPYAWTAVGLPAGLALAATGRITGTPATAGTTAVTIKVTDSQSPAVSRTATLSLVVTAAPPVAPPVAEPGCSSDGVGSAGFPGGYWMAGANGAVYSCGSAPFYGSLVTMGIVPNRPIVGIAATPTGKGYWLVASDGGIFSFGAAGFYGSMGGEPLNAPVVGMAVTSGGGYYEVASDGGIFSFGPGAAFSGSMGGQPLNAPVVGMAVTPGGGYYEVASDGGIFSFGPGAAFHGSTGCLSLDEPVVGMVVSPDATSTGGATACGYTTVQPPGGYQFVAADGGVFGFGSARFAGSLGGEGLTDITGIADD